MSIINDALKKLQNQIGPHDVPHPSHNSDSPEKNGLTATRAPVIAEDAASVRSKVTHKSARKPRESHLVLILVVLCLLTGLLLPVVNKKSLLITFYEKASQYFQRFQIARPFQAAAALPSSQPAETTAPANVEKQSVASVQKTETINTQIAAPRIPASSTVKKSSPKPQSRLIINGIMTQGAKNVVLIDGQIYEEGDAVDGIKLLKITTKGVTILEDGEERFVKVMGQ